MNWLSKSRVYPVFGVAAVLRLLLAIANRWANDNHMEVVYKILDTGRIPVARECWECHHPKAFYLATAGLVKLFHVPHGNPSIIVAQLLNVTISLVALFVFARFISRLAIANPVRNLVFITVALSTCWGGIAAQATTDSFAISFSLMAFVSSYGFFLAPSGRRLLLCALFCALTAVSKFSGALITLLVAFNIGLAFLSERRAGARAALRSLWFVGALLLLAPLPYLGGYVSSARITGDPFTMIMEKYELPSFFKETTRGRPGIQSIWSGYFTFRLPNMLQFPYTGNGAPAEPLHRTSFWSQLYGRLFYTRFESWPPEWHPRTPLVDHLGRGELVLGLGAVGVFGLGGVVALRGIWRRRRAFLARAVEERDFLQVVALASTAAFLLSLVKVTATLRDFCAIKFMYLLPALFGMAYLYAEGWRTLEERWPRLFRALAAVVVALMFLQVVDLAWLITDLFVSQRR